MCRRVSVPFRLSREPTVASNSLKVLPWALINNEKDACDRGKGGHMPVLGGRDRLHTAPQKLWQNRTAIIFRLPECDLAAGSRLHIPTCLLERCALLYFAKS